MYPLTGTVPREPSAHASTRGKPTTDRPQEGILNSDSLESEGVLGNARPRVAVGAGRLKPTEFCGRLDVALTLEIVR